MLNNIAAGLLILASMSGAVDATEARQPGDLAGTWDIARDGSAINCRIMLRTDSSDGRSQPLGFTPACRHAMPALAGIGRWSMPDNTHLALIDAAGTQVLVFDETARTFTASRDEATYTLTPIALGGRSAAEFKPLDAASGDGFAIIEPIAHRKKAEADAEATPEPAANTAAIPGRYAVMRAKRDTGCMITLDSARIAGGARAQLAPGCRDQGIVVFDPTAWQIIKGELVLTAKAGHKARLAKDGIDGWAKDAKDGGKPLGLKKL